MCSYECKRKHQLPVYSVNAHDEGLYVWVWGAAEFAACLSTEGRPVIECEMVQRTDGRAVGHHCQRTHTKHKQFVCLLPHLQKFAVKNEYFNSAIYNNLIKSNI